MISKHSSRESRAESQSAVHAVADDDGITRA
jgi:hypothetical protein